MKGPQLRRIEDFRRDTTSATQVRRAQFGNGWTFAKDWQPLAKARFTASSARWEAKETIDAGVADAGHFYLQTGGDTRTTCIAKLGVRPCFSTARLVAQSPSTRPLRCGISST